MNFADLPDSIQLLVCEKLLRGYEGNAGHVLRLSSVSKQLQRTVTAAGSFWQAECARIGWAAPQLAVAPATPTNAQPTWFQYFCSRMRVRHQVRSAWKRLVPYLTAWSSRSIQTGNSVAALAQAERILRRPLPWELWELYRYRNGQAPEKGVELVEGSRMLGLQEAIKLAQKPLVASSEPGKEAKSPTGMLIPVVDGPQSFVVDSAGKVFRSSGVSTVFITGSVTGFLQHIMR